MKEESDENVFVSYQGASTALREEYLEIIIVIIVFDVLMIIFVEGGEI